MDQTGQLHSEAQDGGIVGLLVLPESPNATQVVILMSTKALKAETIRLNLVRKRRSL